MRTILGIILFYGRFGLSFSAIGYVARKLFWSDAANDLDGKTILVTGASGGIGAAVVRDCAAAGANVIAVARNPGKLAVLSESINGDCQTLVCDLADTAAVKSLVANLQAQGTIVDVLVNNVGVMLHEFRQNTDGVDAQFATNLLNQFVLTEAAETTGVIATDGCVITVASGGMYMAPLVTAGLASSSTEAHDGTRAYAIQKRAQVVLNQHWADSASENRRYYVMHPGWVDTDGVKDSLPTFRRLLAPILRNAAQGADTISWLAKTQPEMTEEPRIWLDRKPRKTHAYGFTKSRSETTDALLAYLRRFL
ncbi:MAG: SDR family NAD(P)-dependent oxidoreductase [Woeseiaceae bacterium]